MADRDDLTDDLVRQNRALIAQLDALRAELELRSDEIVRLTRALEAARQPRAATTQDDG